MIVEDIYFITRLSHRGVLVNLGGTGCGGDPLSVQDYVNTYSFLGTHKSRTHILIAQITIFPLKVLVRTIVRVVGSSTLHLATVTHMHIAVECLWGVMYDWCSSLVPIMKKQLLDCRRGRNKKFGYMIILVAFFFFEITYTNTYSDTCTHLFP